MGECGLKLHPEPGKYAMLVRNNMKRGDGQDAGSSLPPSYNDGEGFLGQAARTIFLSSKMTAYEASLEYRVALSSSLA